MSIASKPLAEVQAADVAGLVGADPDPRRLVPLATWSAGEAAIAAASLANTSGGLVIIGAEADAGGKISGLPGASVSTADLAGVARDLGPGSEALIETALVDVDGKTVGLIRVAETGSPPVLVETTGSIYSRSDSGLVHVLHRSELDVLMKKDRLLRDRAETNVNGMISRTAFGHFNYMTVAVVGSPRMATQDVYKWANANHQALLDLAFSKRWGFTADSISAGAGEIELALPSEATGFIRISRNGTVAAAEREKRPAQDRYLAPAELSERLAEMAAVVSEVNAAANPGQSLGSLFLEGVRDLRLPVGDGLTAPIQKDLFQEWLPERNFALEGEPAAFAADVQATAGNLFGADLITGSAEAYEGPVTISSYKPKAWHGQTKRTERRIAGKRGHGST
ncbi:MAG: helix-turn-helix domain-containing protein [Dehalococcoidia bacterium]